MTVREFEQLDRLLQAKFGFRLSDTKKELAENRLHPRMARLGLSRWADYLDVVSRDDNEGRIVLSRVTTHHTGFFREPDHFRFLETAAFPLWAAKPDRTIRILSAGCSTGAEPYSIALLLHAPFPAPGWNVRILATDIDPITLETAREGRYRSEDLTACFPRFSGLFHASEAAENERVLAKEVRQRVDFKIMNLISQRVRSRRAFDAVFCRNTLIYFPPGPRADIVRHFVDLIVPGGYLVLGHSESLAGSTSKILERVGTTVFKKRMEAT